MLIVTRNSYNRQVVSLKSGAFQGLLDLYPNAAAAYSVRKLRSAYSGAAIRVRRSSDNAEQDIGFTGTGDLDETALTAFVGANDGFVVTWYDQSGNGLDVSQLNPVAQSRIVISGVVQQAGIYFNGTNLVRVGSNLGQKTNGFIACKTGLINTTGSVFKTISSVEDGTLYGSLSHLIGAWLEMNGLFYTYPNALNENYKYVLSYNSFLPIATPPTIRLNTVDSATGYRTNGLGSSGYIEIGTVNGSWGWLGHIHTAVYYGSSQEPNRQNIESFINQTYNAY